MSIAAVCVDCGDRRVFDGRSSRCPACGGVIELDVDRDLTRPVDASAAGLWRFQPWLAPGIERVSLGEVVTPVIDVSWSGMPIRVKLEGLLPTGSFKDRGAAAVIGFTLAQGIARVVEDSSGNAGAAVAAYAARAGIGCEIHAPASASAGKLVQAAIHGAEVVRVPGPRQAAEDSAVARGGATGVTYVPHGYHPYFLEGTRTFAYELGEQCREHWPDAVVMPVGAGTLFLGAYRGFVDLYEAGITPHVPRMYAVQSTACAPLVSLVVGARPASRPTGPSAAEGISIADPVRGPAIIDALQTTGGTAVAVDDTAIWEALGRLGRAGLFVEPTCAVALAGLDALVTAGQLARNADVLVALTGTGLKSSAQVGRHLDAVGRAAPAV